MPKQKKYSVCIDCMYCICFDVHSILNNTFVFSFIIYLIDKFTLSFVVAQCIPHAIHLLLQLTFNPRLSRVIMFIILMLLCACTVSTRMCAVVGYQ